MSTKRNCFFFYFLLVKNVFRLDNSKTTKGRNEKFSVCLFIMKRKLIRSYHTLQYLEYILKIIYVGKNRSSYSYKETFYYFLECFKTTFCSGHFPVATFAVIDHFDAICHGSVLTITNYKISNFIFVIFNIIRKQKVNKIWVFASFFNYRAKQISS